jgi:hypothetical protein
MTNIAKAIADLPGSTESRPSGSDSVHWSIRVALAAWFLLVVSLGAAGAFIVSSGTPPFAIAIGALAPVALFFVALRLSQEFRSFVLALDLRLIAAMQAWRWAGLGFLSLYAYGVLPGVFALTAGLGDMAIGITAPWIVLALVRDPGFAANPRFRLWNVLGILDLAVALSLGAISGVLATGAPGEITAAPMGTLPLVLIPAFLVPLFLMLHGAALMQSRNAFLSEYREARSRAQ